MAHHDLSKLKFLVCDNNVMMQNIITTYLQYFGVKNIIITDDKNCFDVFNTENPDFIILDWMMPDVSGIEITQLIRKSPKSANPFANIIMITAQTDASKILFARDAGITEIICKPIARNILYKKIIGTIETPRNFIRTESFFGPDRRRFEMPNWTHIEKRNSLNIESTIKKSDDEAIHESSTQ